MAETNDTHEPDAEDSEGHVPGVPDVAEIPNTRERAEQAPGDIPTVDGAVRQLEKAALAADRWTRPAPGHDLGTDEGQEVVSLGKDPGGAPEDAVNDAGEN